MTKKKFLKVLEPICRILVFILPIIVGIFDNKREQRLIAEAVSSYMEENRPKLLGQLMDRVN